MLEHSLGSIKAWHQRLQLRVPLDAAGDFRRFTYSLSRFQGVQRRIIFPIHARAVRSLLRFQLEPHPPCPGVAGGCTVCRLFLHQWRDCLCAALTTVVCGRCAETAALQVCDRWENYDGLAGYRRFEGGSLINIKVRKNDQIRKGHRPRIGAWILTTSLQPSSGRQASPRARAAPSARSRRPRAWFAHRCSRGPLGATRRST